MTTELEKWEQLRQVVAELLGHDKDWPAHGNGSLAIAASVAVLKNRNRRLVAVLTAVQKLMTQVSFPEGSGARSVAEEVAEVLKCQQ